MSIQLQIKPRPEVLLFSKAMEMKLKLNDHKGGWENTDLAYLLKRLKEEVNELHDAIINGKKVEILDECVDVGNFAVIIASKIGVLTLDQIIHNPYLTKTKEELKVILPQKEKPKN